MNVKKDALPRSGDSPVSKEDLDKDKKLKTPPTVKSGRCDVCKRSIDDCNCPEEE